jgi:isoquinoline 1-oxidoreductase subunit beta
VTDATRSLVNLSRRGVLAGLGLGAGGLLLGCARAASAATGAEGKVPAQFGPMLSIAPDGAVTLVVPSSEMGQGTQEALARIVAEELDCDFAKASVVLPWADPAFSNPFARRQLTANSMSVTGYYGPLRKLGAASRAMLLQAAAARLSVPVESLVAKAGRITGGPQELTFGDVAADAARLPVPADPRLKDPASFGVIGGRSPRKDLRAKVTGTATFGIDVAEPGMLVAALVLGPHPEARFTAKGLDVAGKMAGVVAVTQVKGGVAILADRFWRAHKASQAVSLDVSASPIAGLSDESLRSGLQAAFDAVEAAPFPNLDLAVFPPKLERADKTQVLATLAAAPRKVEAAYEVPHLAHATMEPICCSAKLTDEGLLIRGPLQDPALSRELGARMTGLPLDKVRVEVTFLGGGFGRKWGTDFVGIAVQAAQAAPGRLVKTVWTREQDFAMDQFRPAFAVRSVAGLDEKGRPKAIHSRIAGESIAAYHRKPPIPGFEGLADANSAAQLVYGAYAVPQKLIEYHRTDLEVPVGFWRSVTMSQNAFFAESFIDELALAAGEDTLAYRLAMLEAQPRARAVLEKAAAMVGWKPRRPGGGRKNGKGRGIAFSYAENSFCAIAAEVTVKGKALTIDRFACAFDCGLAIDPVSTEGQISGGIVFGLQAALWGEVHFAQGRPTAENFGDYRIPLLADIPPIEVALIRGGTRPGPVGEASTPVVAPALCNAIADAGGPRIRALPIARSLDI